MMEIPTDPRIAGGPAAFPDSQVELWGGLYWLPLFGSPASLPEVRQEAGLVVSCWLEPSGYFQAPVEYCQCLGVTGLCVGHLAPSLCLVRSFRLSAPRVHSLLSEYVDKGPLVKVLPSTQDERSVLQSLVCKARLFLYPETASIWGGV